MLDSQGQQHSLVLVMYKFDGAPEHRVRIHPHGNSKSTQPFCCTMTSVKTQLAHELVTQTPTEAIHKVYTTKGGVIGARSAGELPLHQQQAYNIKHKVKKQRFEGSSSTACRSTGKGRNLLYIVMEQCTSAERKDRYVQEVTCAPEAMAVLATDQQLVDLDRFCCNPSSFSIIGVDPTFNLGEFSVTPTVYQHLLLTLLANLSGCLDQFWCTTRKSFEATISSFQASSV